MTSAVANTGSVAAYPGKGVFEWKATAAVTMPANPSHRKANADRGLSLAQCGVVTATMAPIASSHIRVCRP
jgi:hypothetical protein